MRTVVASIKLACHLQGAAFLQPEGGVVKKPPTSGPEPGGPERPAGLGPNRPEREPTDQ